jgi:hypothetical protein
VIKLFIRQQVRGKYNAIAALKHLVLSKSEAVIREADATHPPHPFTGSISAAVTGVVMSFEYGALTSLKHDQSATNRDIKLACLA